MEYGDSKWTGQSRPDGKEEDSRLNLLQTESWKKLMSYQKNAQAENGEDMEITKWIIWYG